MQDKDEKLVMLAQKGDVEALKRIFSIYKNFINFNVKSFVYNRETKKDMLQEGLIGLFKAVKNFKDTKNTSFKTFAFVCIKRQILASIKKNKSNDLSSCVDNFDNLYNYTNEKQNIKNQNYLMQIEEKIKNFQKFLNSNLSEFEMKILNLLIENNKYKKISEILNVKIKSVDNAVQRIRKKFNFYYKENVK